MKKEIVSGKYLICIVGIMLLCFTSRFPGSDVDLHEMTLMAFVTYGKSQLLQMGEMASSYSVAVSFRDMEWFIVLLPVMSVLPVVSEFAEEWFSGHYYLSISRTTRIKYTMKWMTKAAAETFVGVVSGIILYFILVYIKFPVYLLSGDAAESSVIANVYGTTIAARGFHLGVSVIHTGMLASVFAMLSIVITIICKECFYAVSGFVLAEYFSKKLSSAYEGFLLYQYYDNGEKIPARYNAIRFLFPSNHLFYDRSFYSDFGIKYGWYLIFLILLIIAICGIFYLQIRRRNE